MKKLNLIFLLFSSIVVSQEAPIERQSNQAENNKIYTQKKSNNKGQVQLEKNAVERLQSQKNLNNEKYADKYHYDHQNRPILCESINNRRSYCSADTRYGVEFLRQLSRSSCDYNWGYDERGIWVTNGCRAEFSVNQGWDQPGGDGNIFVCESDRYQQNYCRVYLQGRDVMLYRQLSQSSCHNNWGYDQGGIWVRNGCRAEFVMEDRYDPRNEMVVCSSMNGQFRMCRADTRGGVEFVRQLSRSSCNYNWGYDHQGIWVANGCRAQFRLLNFNYQPIEPKIVRCSSKGYRQRVCRTGSNNGVRLIKQRSRTTCQGNWGFDHESVWVTNGCRATFEVMPRNHYGYGNNNGYGNNHNNGSHRSRVICESRNLALENCSIPPRSKVRFIRQLSNTSCHSNWGYGNRNIWVKNGCRAEFEVKSE